MDEKKRQKTNPEVFCYLNEVTKNVKHNIFILIIFNMVLGVCSVLYALMLREIINSAVAGNLQEFVNGIIGFGVLILIRMIFSAFNRHLQALTRVTLGNRMRSRLFSELLNRDYGRVTSVHSGEWMNRLTSDTSVVAGSLIGILPGLAGLFTRLVGALIALVALEPRLLYLILPVGILAVLGSYSLRKIMKRLHKEIQELKGKTISCFQEKLGDMLVIRTFDAGKESEKEADERMENQKNAEMRQNDFSNICNTIFGLAMNAIYVAGVIFCGYGILTGTMSYGTLVAVLQLVSQVQGPISNISGYLPQYYSMVASVERLLEVENLPKDSEEPESLSEIQKCYEKDFESFGFRNAKFTYLSPDSGLGEFAWDYKEESDASEKNSTQTAAISGVSLEVKKGESVAFVGPSGCGKSTLLKLLMCLYQLDEGECYICVDGMEKPMTTKWRRLFAYVPQGNGLMSGTIREIVTLADRDRIQNDEEIWEALEIACADGFVSELEDGLDTVLGERGAGLSEGQMQRLSIARAVFSEYPILLLDECTSALDEETERKLLDHLQTMTGKTVVIVTHRQAALSICDKIVRFSTDGSVTTTCNKETEDENLAD